MMLPGRLASKENSIFSCHDNICIKYIYNFTKFYGVNETRTTL